MPKNSIRLKNMAGAAAAGLALLAGVHAAIAAPQKVVYKFPSNPTGLNPSSSLLNIGGTLYGTTSGGGSAGQGTVFSVTPAGVEKVIYSFKGGADGAGPSGALVNIGNTLYGTTLSGGSASLGTVFSLTTDGVEKVLYSFKGDDDGAQPNGGLLNVGGTFYGTTLLGGGLGGGSVFSITPAGVESVVYGFQAGTDGFAPASALINVGGTLYGTTTFGGDVTVNAGRGFGTVFSCTTSGYEKVVYEFHGDTDGAVPYAGLLNIGGTLYGTTYFGGSLSEAGTVYSVTTAGVEKVVHVFDGKDGVLPQTGLIEVKGVLYGTTTHGGSGTGVEGNGTVFSITPAGKEKVVYAFKGKGDGQVPQTGLINIGNKLYGTTAYGGNYEGGGVVYSLAIGGAAKTQQSWSMR